MGPRVVRLRDSFGQSGINARLRHASLGNLGDVAPVREGVSEMRIFYGPGYRLYFIQQVHAPIMQLCGGDMSSQSRDIERAKALARDWTTSP
jgi:putative addiction module killer protein